MALNLLLLLMLINFLVFTDAVQAVGVCYGNYSNHLPSEQEVVNLYKSHVITGMRIYAPNPAILQALGRTRINLILGVPNDSLESLTNPNAATAWVRTNVLNYPDVNFKYIAVGNEVDPNNPDTSMFVQFVYRAMLNVYRALKDAQRADQIKVSTATYTGLLKVSSPPSQGVFNDNVVNFIGPIIKFLDQTGAPMLANIYPYFAYVRTPSLQGKIEFALFTKTTPELSDQNRPYYNLFDAMYDAHYAAQSRLGGRNVEIVVSESGWPSMGGVPATRDYAGMYYKNLISHVKSAKGTPARPKRVIETYLFAMFDENLKTGKETERHFGVFLDNKELKYPQLSF